MLSQENIKKEIVDTIDVTNVFHALGAPDLPIDDSWAARAPARK